MYRAALRTATRAGRSAPTTTLTSTSRRYLSSGAPSRRRTWKGGAVRWGLAFGALYWYNTSPLFTDELPPQTIPAPPQFSDADLPTVDSVIEQKRKEAEAKAQKAAPTPPPPSEDKKEEKEKPAEGSEAAPAVSGALPGSPEALEEEAGQQGAFNPETGEINWDCPCLGGMADGPCGEEFKAAFSCFVYSTEEPKGMDCIDKFQHMQDCFRKYPEIYGSELSDEEGEESPEPPAAGEEDALAPKTDKKESQEISELPAVEAPKTEKKMPAAPSKSTSAPKID